MSNITYLFGAGASCNALPIYSNFHNRFEIFSSFIKNYQQQISNNEVLYKQMLDKIIEIEKELQYHATPDTLAKKLFHKSQQNDLIELKNILTLFFIYEQISEKNKVKQERVDKRYDAFVAAILKPIPNKFEFSDNIKILSWNYDLQFEIACSQYLDTNIICLQNKIQSYPKVIVTQDRFEIGSFSIVHLNGIAYFDRDIGPNLIGQFIAEPAIIGEYLLSVYKNMHTNRVLKEINSHELLNFAWENISEEGKINNNGIFKKAILIAEQTNILIVNGYSFPVFNRIIDNKLIEAMVNLEKIYIQSPNANNIKKILKELIKKPDIELIDVEYWEPFYIP